MIAPRVEGRGEEIQAEVVPPNYVSWASRASADKLQFVLVPRDIIAGCTMNMEILTDEHKLPNTTSKASLFAHSCMTAAVEESIRPENTINKHKVNHR